MQSTRSIFRAAAVVALLTAPAAAQDAVAIKLAHVPGERWAIARDTEFDSNVTIAADGKVVQTQVSSRTETRRATMEILETRDGAATALRVAFDAGCAVRTSTGGEPAVETHPGYAGATVTIRARAGAATEVDCPAKFGDDERRSLENMVEPDLGFLPKGPVKPGDTWTADTAVLARMLGLGPDDRASAILTLREVALEGGRRVAIVNTTLSIHQTQQGMIHLDMDAAGPVVLDLATGADLRYDLTGPTKFSGAADKVDKAGKKIHIVVTGTGTMSMKSRTTPSSPAAASAGVHEGGAPGLVRGEEAMGATRTSAPAATTATASTPEAVYAAQLLALRANDIDAFRRRCTAEARAAVTDEAFARMAAVLAAKGAPAIDRWEPAWDGVRAVMKDGNALTVYVREGSEWRCDALWIH